ncbi:MAG TPA: peptidoglycan DD-metalloendopeptidase family protein [Terriglobales bacterium]|nr:peptidoglycan DD-metalloendopeptidase family protein [Terriglobales bacterium]
MKKVILLLILVVVVLFFAIRVTTSPKPEVDVTLAGMGLGQSSPMTVHVHHPKGVHQVTTTVTQNGSTYKVWELPQPTKDVDGTWSFNVGTRSTPQLKDGNAELVVEAKSNGMFAKTARWQHAVNVVTQPPSVTADSDQHYLYRGMADLATMNISGHWTEAGVKVGDQKFRAWPMPNGKPGFFSLYAFAWNMPDGTAPVAFASNGVGNDVTSPLVVQFPKKEQPHYTEHQLPLDDKFIQKVVNELDPNGSGDMVQRFVKINSEMRKANNKTLSDLRLKSADHFLWSQVFLRQPGAKNEATFADHRVYIYQGKKIDEQTHLGYDLAVTQHVGVQASNDGVVVYAAPLGIYGNCIVVDHGYGLQTIYGHLSQIQVKDGDQVKRGQVMGLSGMTGMAGGDHIHFTMQLDGVQIDPKSWWDPHWIKDHIAKRVDLAGFSGD